MQGLRLNLDKSSISQLKTEVNEVISSIEAKKLNLKTDTSNVRDELKKITGSVNQVLEQYEKLGKVTQPKMFYDKDGNLQKFIFQLEQAEGIIQRISYSAMADGSISTRAGSPIPTNYKIDSVVESDNRVKLYNSQLKEAQGNLQKLEEEEQRLANLMAEGREKVSNESQLEQERQIIENENKQYQEALDLLNRKYELIGQITKAKEQELVETTQIKTEELQTVEARLQGTTNNLSNTQKASLLVEENALIENQTMLETRIQDQQNLQNQKIERQIELYKEVASIRLQNLQTMGGDALKNNEIISQIEKFKSALASLNTTNFDASRLNSQFSQIQANVRSVNAEVNNSQGVVGKLLGTISHDIGAMGQWMISGTLIFGSLRGIKEGIQDIVDMDNTLATLKITMNGTEQQFKDMAGAIQQTAIQTGSSVQEVSEAAKTYANAMESTESILAKTKSAIMLGNVTGLNSKEVTDSINVCVEMVA